MLGAGVVPEQGRARASLVGVGGRCWRAPLPGRAGRGAGDPRRQLSTRSWGQGAVVTGVGRERVERRDSRSITRSTPLGMITGIVGWRKRMGWPTLTCALRLRLR